MGIFSYKDLDENASKALFSDALAISTYAYHNIDNGFDEGYHQTGFGLGLPLTLITALIGSTQSQGGLPGIPWNPDSEQAAQETVNNAGWSVISAAQLGYAGKTDARGTYYGETAGYTTAQAEVLGKYDSEGNLTAIGISFRGTSGPRESLIGDTIGDVINDLLAGFGPKGYADGYTLNAFGNLLGDVAKFAQAHGLSGEDVVVSGHSLGGLAVNSMAAQSDANWGGFYAQSNYIAFASPTQYEAGGKVINIGYENDPVFRALDGTSLTLPSLGVHDAPHASATNNIVNFNDHYASDAWNLLPFSILNIPTWLSHLPFFYQDGLMRVLNSEFYSLTDKDSTIIVSNLSNVTRGNTWVEDLNRNAETHSGPTFIIGSDGNDLIKGGKGNDYLEGRDGDDIFRDAGGYNLIAGGKGHNIFDTQQALKNTEVAYDGNTLYLRDAKGGITLADDISTLRSKETSWLIFSKEVDHQVTAAGLKSDSGLKAYAAATTGGDGDDVLQARSHDAWLFGNAGNDTLIGHAGGNLTFVGGSGDDILKGAGNGNTFLFSGDFGRDQLYGFNATDKLVFIGTEGASGNIRDYATQQNDDLVLAFGHSQVTLIGVSLDHFNTDQVVLA
ncbi:TPA: polyurethanase [Serratia marcescens]